VSETVLDAAGLCQACTGPWFNGAVPIEDSLARARGCSRPATVTLRGGCVHEHVKEKRYCGEHGQVESPAAAWFCLECADLGHDCPVTPVVVTS
jgi:hypothetical protein